jgi:hypothetical protein
MAQLNFPDNPVNGQLYPNPCPTGVTQYRWDSGVGIWRIVGVATDVAPGTYGSDAIVGQFTVDVTGRITEAANVAIRQASLTEPGIVQLNDTLSSLNPNEALTARAGKRLQDQIGNLTNCIVPSNANVVEALNDLQQQSTNLQENACIWCGYYNALEGDISYVSITGFRLGYRIGQELPTPGPKNGGDFFIVNYGGNPYIAGDFNAPNQFIENGNWIISEVNVWSEVAARGGKIKAADVEYTANFPLTANNVQNALFQITQLFRTGIGGATVSPTKPPNPYPGQLWWDNDDGLFYIYYRDSNGDQWVEASGSAGGIASGLGVGGGSVYEVKTGRGLTGGPIVTTGTLSLKPAFKNEITITASEIGGVVPNLGFNYNNTTGLLNLKVSSDATGKDAFTAFSQEGANVLNSKINYVAGNTVLAGTYDDTEKVLVSVTPAGAAAGFVVGEDLPAPTTQTNNFFVIVTISGDEAQSGDWYLSASQAGAGEWVLINYQQVLSSASNIDVEAIPGLDFSGTVQTVLEDLQLQVSNRVGGVQSLSSGLVTQLNRSGLFGSSLTLDLLPASTENAGVVQLTNDVTGNSESLAVSQFGLNQLNEKVNSLVGGTRILAGTFNSSTGLMASVTPIGQAAGFFVDEAPPNANLVPDDYYVIVTVLGGFAPPNATGVPSNGTFPGDWFLSSKASNSWVCVSFNGLTAAAQNISISPISDLTATNVQSALGQLRDELDTVIWNLFAEGTGLKVRKEPLLGGLGSNTFLELRPASADGLGGVAVLPGSGLTLTDEGALSVAPATTNVLGAVKVGDNLTVDASGRLSAVIPPAQPQVQIKLLDDISSGFTGRKATFVATVAGYELPRSVNINSLFVFLDGLEQRPEVDFNWDPLNSLITFAAAPAVGVKFSARVFSL